MAKAADTQSRCSPLPTDAVGSRYIGTLTANTLMMMTFILPGEQFVGTSFSSSSSSKTVNGKTVSEGSGSVIINDNGKTDEQHVLFHEGDKDDGEE